MHKSEMTTLAFMGHPLSDWSSTQDTRQSDLPCRRPYDAGRRSADTEALRPAAESAYRLSERVRNPGRSGPPLKRLGVRESPAGVGRLPAGLRPREATVQDLEVCPVHWEPHRVRGRRHGAVRATENVGRTPGSVNRSGWLVAMSWEPGGSLHSVARRCRLRRPRRQSPCQTPGSALGTETEAGYCFGFWSR